MPGRRGVGERRRLASTGTAGLCRPKYHWPSGRGILGHREGFFEVEIRPIWLPLLSPGSAGSWPKIPVKMNATAPVPIAKRNQIAGKVRVKHAPRPIGFAPAVTSPCNWLARTETNVMPSPLRCADWVKTPRDKFSFIRHTEGITRIRLRSNRTLIFPLPCFAAFVTSSLTIRPIGWICVVGTNASVPSTAISVSRMPDRSPHRRRRYAKLPSRSDGSER